MPTEYTNLDLDVSIAKIAQPTRDRVRQSQDLSLSDYVLHHDWLYYRDKLWIPEDDNL